MNWRNHNNLSKSKRVRKAVFSLKRELKIRQDHDSNSQNQQTNITCQEQNGVNELQFGLLKKKCVK